jgi:hypothetical protein
LHELLANLVKGMVEVEVRVVEEDMEDSRI